MLLKFECIFFRKQLRDFFTWISTIFTYSRFSDLQVIITPMTTPLLTDLIRSQEAPWFSCEFFPPRTSDGYANLLNRAKRLVALGALFVSVTWGAGGSTCNESLELALSFQKELGVPVVLHLTCTNMSQEILDNTLTRAHEGGIRNILALRGDRPRSDYAEKSELTWAEDLVQYIRSKYSPEDFCIGVAGYPEGFADSLAMNQSVEHDIPYLVNKIKAGGQFIMSQLFYNESKFEQYTARLHEFPELRDIPILPGIMPVNSYRGLLRSCKLSHASLPSNILNDLDSIDKQDDHAVKAYGVELLTSIITDLKEKGISGFHFFTLNLEKSLSQVVVNCGLSSSSNAPLKLIDEFPNGRYTDTSSAAFGEIDGYGPVVHGTAQGSANPSWPSINSVKDISRFFIGHITNELPEFPFSDQPLNAETGLIQEDLIELNRRGYWTLSSQPAISKADSSDNIFGWGPQGGQVWQRAFVEMFVDAEVWKSVKLPTKGLTWYAAYETGDIESGGDSPNVKNVVTWGVWPSSKAHSTIISADSFTAWRDEAFSVLRAWQDLYPSDLAAFRALAAARKRVLVTFISSDAEDEDGLWKFLAELPEVS